jgi:type II secretory pathway component PulF
MAMFKYSALTESERLMEGTIEASSKQEAEQMLAKMQLKVSSLEKSAEHRIKSPIGRDEFLLFNQQLASITKSGIPFERGLRELSKDIASSKMKKLINQIADDLEKGMSIEEAFKNREKIFPPLYSNILKAGIETGRLSDMLANLNRHIETSNQTKRVVFEALAYPAVIVAIASVISTMMFILIIPKFKEIFHDMTDRPLPGLTQFIFSLTDHIVFIWAGIGIVIVSLIVLYISLSSSPAGRKFKEKIILNLPLIGSIFRSSSLSKLAESMSMMISSGSDMPTVLRLSGKTSGSEIINSECDGLAAQVEKGENIIEAGQFCRMIPRMFLYSVQLGTQRNELQDNLYSLGQMYYEQVRCTQTRLQVVLLPTMLIIVGGYLFTIILSIFLPIMGVISGLTG